MSSIEEIYLIHHSHTDIGYTHDQPVVWDLHRRFINDAIELAERDVDVEKPHAFKWTIEATAPLLHWFQTTTDTQIERFQALESAGQIEITAMFANITPLYGPAQTVESLRPVDHLRDEFDFNIRYAMNCDVNGQNWPLVEVLRDAGIEGFSMAVNEHYGGSPLERPLVFHWEGASGKTIPVLNGFNYAAGGLLGIGHDMESFRDTWLPKLETIVKQGEYSFPILPVQGVHPFGDNGPPYDQFTTFIQQWNEQEEVLNGEFPNIRMATPSDWWEAILEYQEDFPTFRGDWTDFWAFGAGSTAYETAVNRENRRRLLTADAFEAVLEALDKGKSNRPPTRQSAFGLRDSAWSAVNLYDEHTFGSDLSVSSPTSDDTRSQLNHQLHCAHKARSISQMLQRDSIAELARQIPREE